MITITSITVNLPPHHHAIGVNPKDPNEAKIAVNAVREFQDISEKTQEFCAKVSPFIIPTTTYKLNIKRIKFRGEFDFAASSFLTVVIDVYFLEKGMKPHLELKQCTGKYKARFVEFAKEHQLSYSE